MRDVTDELCLLINVALCLIKHLIKHSRQLAKLIVQFCNVFWHACITGWIISYYRQGIMNIIQRLPCIMSPDMRSPLSRLMRVMKVSLRR